MNLLLTKRFFTPSRLLAAAAGLIVLIAFAGIVARVGAASANPAPASGRLITLHDRGVERVFVTTKSTLREAFAEANIAVDPKDKVEPALDDQLAADEYTVNVYRARPMVVVDGGTRQKIVTAAQVPEHIASDAGLTLYPEDTTSLSRSTDLLADGASLQLTIARAVPFTFTLYGETLTARTQAKTVGDMLRDKKITLGEHDRVSLPLETPITAGLEVRVWREGKQTVTVDEEVAFQTEQIKDANREVGYKQVQTPGEKGKRSVTYEVTVQDGKEVVRVEIASVAIKEAKKQVEVVGAKPTFSGDFQAALAKLRSCEGGYNSWNPAGPYYGAYQFDQRTWASVTSAPYGNATPAEQDEAAYQLYLRRGWTPWPVCGAQRLPDIYR